MMRRTQYVVAASWGVVMSALAFDASATTTVGAPSCGSWVSERAKGQTMMTLAEQNWLVGYLSGVAVGAASDFLKGTDNASLFLWVDNYCRANPLKNLAAAGTELAVELDKQMGR